MSRNAIYNAYFTDKSNPTRKYKLSFVPGDVTDLSSPAVYTFPRDIITQMPEANIAYDADLPRGLFLSGDMKIIINLERMKQGVWTDVRDYILARQSPTKRTVYTQDISHYIEINIPNRWTLYSNDGDGTTNYNTVEFDGVQVYKAKPTTKITRSGEVVEKEIIVCDMPRAIFEKETIDLIHTTATVTGKTRAYDWIHTETIETGLRTYAKYEEKVLDGTDKFDLMSMTALKQNKQYPAQEILRAYARNASAALTLANHPYFHMDLYKQNKDTANTRGDVFSDASNELHIMSKVYNDNETYDGMLVQSRKSDSDVSLYEYENTWELIKTLAGGNVLKTSYSYTSAAPAITFTYNKILDATTARSDAEKTLTPRHFKSDIEITEEAGVINSVTSNMKDTADGDPTEIKSQVMMELSADDATLQHAAHNHVTGTDDIVDIPETRYIRNKRGCWTIRNLYYLDGSDVMRIHDYVRIDLGDSVYYASQADYAAQNMPMWTIDDTVEGRGASYCAELKDWLYYRLARSGIGFVAANAYFNLFKNPSQAFIKAQVRIDKARLMHIGDTYTINLNNLIKDGSYMNPPFSEKAILTNVTCHYAEGYSDCTFWARGTEI